MWKHTRGISRRRKSPVVSRDTGLGRRVGLRLRDVLVGQQRRPDRALGPHIRPRHPATPRFESPNTPKFSLPAPPPLFSSMYAQNNNNFRKECSLTSTLSSTWQGGGRVGTLAEESSLGTTKRTSASESKVIGPITMANTRLLLALSMISAMGTGSEL